MPTHIKVHTLEHVPGLKAGGVLFMKSIFTSEILDSLFLDLCFTSITFILTSNN